MAIPLDYETLRLIWWVLLGVLLIGFALTDGYDLGVATLLPFIARSDEERRLVINSVAPHWEGHQVWLILGGGAIFAAWPFVYAVSFSGFYLAMFLVLATLIVRPLAFKYRSKHADAAWRARWDWALFVSGLVPALVFGVAVGNVLAGAPFRLDADLRSHYEGSLLGLFSPFALVAGLLSVAMLVVHGAGWLMMKVEQGPVWQRVRRFGAIAAVVAVALFGLGGLMIGHGAMGVRLLGTLDPAGPSNPHYAMMIAAPGAWLDNYVRHPLLLAAPLAGVTGFLFSLVGIRWRHHLAAFAGSSLAIIGVIATVGVSMFPFILPSSIDAGSSLTVWNASSSHLTLWIMLVVTVILLPIVLAYTSWAFKVMFGRISLADIRTNPDFY